MGRSAGDRTMLVQAVMLLAILISPWWMAAHAQSVDEAKVAQVKAAYLANFLRFTQWPASAFSDDDAPVVIVMIEPDPLARHLDVAVRRLRISDRPVVVHRLNWPTRSDYRNDHSYEQARQRAGRTVRQSHLLYLPPAVLEHAPDLLKAVAEAPVLTVGDGHSFMHHGTMLALDLEKDRIIFHANAKQIQQSPISVSSRLLTLAKLYEP